MPKNWSIHSWTDYPNAQPITYKSAAELAQTKSVLKQKPALVHVRQIKQLQKEIARAGIGERFIIHAGDCAESFSMSNPKAIHAQLKLIQSLQLKLSAHLNQPVIAIGRIAGQFAKPRTYLHETHQGITLPSYRGDLVNQTYFDIKSRTTCPKRLLKGYYKAAHTHQFIQKKAHAHFYTSHEALHLEYESALTRKAQDNLYYNTSTHLPWLGMRTTQIDGAHVEFLRGIQNPIGIKLGPHTTPCELTELITRLNPHNTPGKILLITRMGATKIHEVLPPLIQIIHQHQHSVTWSCDPMHGNTQTMANGIKSRNFDCIWDELKAAHDIHQAHRSILGGIHLELTPENVTECLGGESGVTETDLSKNYKSLLDPRLNASQALEMVSAFTTLHPNTIK